MSKTYEIAACVVGLSNNYKETFGTRPGVGKSCLCFRLAYPDYDDFVDSHPSLFALHEFESQTINSNHFIYWGSPVKLFPVRGGDCRVKFHLVEQTVLYQDVTSLPFSHSVTKPDHVDNYVKRIVGPMESSGKVSYHSRDTVSTSMPAGLTAVTYPQGITRVPRGFIVIFDVSVTGKALDMQCKRVDPVLTYLSKHKKKFIIVVTKRDKYSMPSLERAYELRKKYRTHLVESSSLEDLNTEEVLRVLALTVLTKKTSGLSDQVMRYHDAAQHVLLRRTTAKSSFKAYVRKKVLNYDERLSSVQLSEEFKACAQWIGGHRTGCIFALHVLELYNSKVEENYAGVKEDPDMHLEYLEDFVDQRTDIVTFKAEMKRWISSYINDFKQHSFSPSKSSVPTESGAATPSSALSPPPSPFSPTFSPYHSGHETGSTGPVPAPETSSVQQVPEGYHIFESVSKVSKEMARQDVALETTEKTADGASAEEVELLRGGGEGGVSQPVVEPGKKGKNEEDNVSVYSCDSMESVSDHDYLNFDPKSGGVWPEEAMYVSPTCTKAEASIASTSPGHAQEAKSEDDSDSDCDYENMRDFVGDTEYMNIMEIMQKNTSKQTCDADSAPASDVLPAAAQKVLSTKPPPTVSPKPSFSSRSKKDQLSAMTASLPKLHDPASTDQLPSTASNLSSSASSANSPPSLARSPSELRKTKPPAPVRKSSLNTPNTTTNSTTSSSSSSSSNAQSSSSESSPGGDIVSATSGSPSTAGPGSAPKPQRPVARSSSIKQRAKLLEMSMSSPSDSTSTSTEEMPTSSDKGDSNNERDNRNKGLKTPSSLSTVPEHAQLVSVQKKLQAPYLENRDTTTAAAPAAPAKEEATWSSNRENDVGTQEVLSQLSEKIPAPAAPKSPSSTTVVATTAPDSATTNTNGGPSLASDLLSPSHSKFGASQENGSSEGGNGLQKRPRLSRIKSKLAQRKEAAGEVTGKTTSRSYSSDACDGEEGGSIAVDEVFLSSPPLSSVKSPDRPSLAEIKKRVRGGGSSANGEETTNNSPFRSINIPPVSSRPPAPPKRGSAPSSVMTEILSPERQRELGAQYGEKNAPHGNNPPPIPERLPSTYDDTSSPRATRSLPPRSYHNVMLPLPDESSNHTNSSAADSNAKVSDEVPVPLPKKKKGLYPFIKAKKDEKSPPDVQDQAAKGSPNKKFSAKKEESARDKERPLSPTKKVSKKDEAAKAAKELSKKDGKAAGQKENKSPTKKTVKALAASKSKNTGKDQQTKTKAKFMVMANRPLPLPPGHSSTDDDTALDHSENDYEKFDFDKDDQDYQNYLPPEAVGGSPAATKLFRRHSLEMQPAPPTVQKSPQTSPRTEWKSSTMVRAKKISAASVYDEGYVNSDLLPDRPSGYLTPVMPLPPRGGVNATGTGAAMMDKVKEDDLDYDYPDAHLTSAFTSRSAQRAAINKLQQLKRLASQQQKLSGTASGNHMTTSEKVGGWLEGRGLAVKMLGEDGDDAFRDRSGSDASSAYVPMADLYPFNEDTYVNSDMSPPTQEAEVRGQKGLSSLQPHMSSLDHEGLVRVAGKLADSQEPQFGGVDVYMNLPTPMMAAAPQRTNISAAVSPLPVPTLTKPRSATTATACLPKPKPRSVTLAAESPAEFRPPAPREGWNKPSKFQSNAGDVTASSSLPPRNVPRP